MIFLGGAVSPVPWTLCTKTASTAFCNPDVLEQAQKNPTPFQTTETPIFFTTVQFINNDTHPTYLLYI